MEFYNISKERQKEALLLLVNIIQCQTQNF